MPAFNMIYNSQNDSEKWTCGEANKIKECTKRKYLINFVSLFFFFCALAICDETNVHILKRQLPQCKTPMHNLMYGCTYFFFTFSNILYGWLLDIFFLSESLRLFFFCTICSRMLWMQTVRSKRLQNAMEIKTPRSYWVRMVNGRIKKGWERKGGTRKNILPWTNAIKYIQIVVSAMYEFQGSESSTLLFFSVCN